MPRPKRSPRVLLEKTSPPMLATLVSGIPPDPGAWLYEIKYDGFRAIAAVADGESKVWSRNALDLGPRFPHVPEAISKLAATDAVLDGEIVALDERGVSRFQLLQQGELDDRTVFVAFDLLWRDGEDLRGLPVEERRKALIGLIGRGSKRGVIRLAEQLRGDAEALLAEAAEEGHEGLIAKRSGSVYENRRSKAWIKLKAINAQELAIIGFTPSTNSDRELGSLLLGHVDDGKMVYAGRVGTGFSSKQRVELKKTLTASKIERPSVVGAPRLKGATWVEPELVAQVRFTEWTADGKLRHPSFLGFRPDKSPWECRRERPATSAKKAGEAMEKKEGKTPRRKAAKKVAKKKAAPAAKGRSPKKAPRKEPAASLVKLTSPDRILFPRDRITKREVAEYYDAVAPAMIAALDDRPLAMEHWNDGIDKGSWFQQNIGKEAEPWMTLIETPTRTSKRTVRHFVADSPAALRWLAQHSVLTTHMWSSRGENLEQPDWIVFDLDPAKGKGIEQAIEAALVFRRLLDKLELPSLPKTSGKRGIHILVPLAPGHSHEEAVEFACTIGDAVASRVEDFTTERALSKRKGRLYLDCLQNGYGKTIVAPYSLRAADGAPVSAPLEWSEINRRLDPSKFNLRTMPNRLAKKGDLFRAALEGGVSLPRLK
jgi:bifunctional non-homologous end joining protein LigD